jgi:POT family proton-dependent oligopeptide transporter
MLSYQLQLLWLLVLITNNETFLGPIGDSPLLDQTSSKRTKEIAVYVGALISIPLIFIMIKNTDYTDYFMYAIGPLAILYFLYETFKEKEEASRKKLIAAFIFILFYRFGHSTNKVVVL